MAHSTRDAWKAPRGQCSRPGVGVTERATWAPHAQTPARRPNPTGLPCTEPHLFTLMALHTFQSVRFTLGHRPAHHLARGLHGRPLGRRKRSTKLAVRADTRGPFPSSSAFRPPDSRDPSCVQDGRSACPAENQGRRLEGRGILWDLVRNKGSHNRCPEPRDLIWDTEIHRENHLGKQPPPSARGGRMGTERVSRTQELTGRVPQNSRGTARPLRSGEKLLWEVPGEARTGGSCHRGNAGKDREGQDHRPSSPLPVPSGASAQSRRAEEKGASGAEACGGNTAALG